MGMTQTQEIGLKVSAQTARIPVTASPSAPLAIPPGTVRMRFINLGVNVCYVAIGNATVSAGMPTTAFSQSSIPIMPDEVVYFDVTKEVSVSAVCDALLATVLCIVAW